MPIHLRMNLLTSPLTSTKSLILFLQEFMFPVNSQMCLYPRYTCKPRTCIPLAYVREGVIEFFVEIKKQKRFVNLCCPIVEFLKLCFHRFTLAIISIAHCVMASLTRFHSEFGILKLDLFIERKWLFSIIFDLWHNFDWFISNAHNQL